MLVPAIFLAAFGLLIGSFAAVVAYRVPIGESPLTGRSRCDSCGETVAGYDNIPVISWLLLRGRCRHCGVSIPARYPLAEVAVAAGFAGSYLAFESDGAAWVALACVFIAMLATITLTDIEDQIIPNVVIGPAAIIGFVLLVVADPDEIAPHLIAAAAAGGFLLVVALLYPRGMGMGDVKLAAVMGIFLGPRGGPCAPDRVRRRRDLRHRADRPTRTGSAQAEGPVRAVSGARRGRRPLRGRRHRRLVSGLVHPLSAA